MSFRGFVGLTLFLLIVGLIGFFTWQSRYEWIERGEVGVFYSVSAGLEPKVYGPQRIFVPFLKELHKYPTKWKVARYTQDVVSGEESDEDGITVTTNDNGNTVFDVTVIYNVDPKDVPLIYEKFSIVPLETIQHNFLRGVVGTAATSAASHFDVYQLMGPMRVQASQMLTDNLRDVMKANGLTLKMAFFERAYPQEQVLERVTNRVNATTDMKIAEITNQKSEIEKQIKVVTATAQTKAAALSAAQSGTRSMEMMDLDLDLKAAKKWKGHVGRIQRGSKDMIVCGRDLSQYATAQEQVAPQAEEATQ